LRYLDEVEESHDRVALLSDSLAKALHASIGGKKLPSIRKQLERLKEVE